MSDYLVALTTIDSADSARRLARDLVERRLVACVNIVPKVVSLYRWQGAIEEAEEYLLILKTRAEKLEVLEQSVKELHPYDVPELIAVTVEAGAGPYLDWVTACLEPTAQD